MERICPQVLEKRTYTSKEVRMLLGVSVSKIRRYVAGACLLNI